MYSVGEWIVSPWNPMKSHQIFIWLVVSDIFLFSTIYGLILPIDFHIFQDGWNHQPVIVDCYPLAI